MASGIQRGRVPVLIRGRCFAIVVLLILGSLALSTALGQPSITTGFATEVGSNSVTFTGTITPNSQTAVAWFDYGSDFLYGSRTALSTISGALGPVSLSAPVSNLISGQIYHWRAVATNANGIAYGEDQAFQTLGAGTGSSLSFDGNSSFVALPVFDLSGSNSVTIEAWIKPKDLTNSMESEIICQSTSIGPTPDFLLSFRQKGTVFAFDLTAGTTYRQLQANITPSSLADGYWHHVAGTCDGTLQNLYIDGMLVASGSQSGNIHFSAMTNTLGAFNGSAAFFRGLIDELRIWRGCHNLDQLSRLMFQPLVGTETGLLGYWRLDEGRGSTAADSSLHGLTGLLNATTWVAENAPLVMQPIIPAVFTGSATNQTTNSVTIGGILNPCGSAVIAYFEYGLTAQYGMETSAANLGEGWSPSSLTNQISGLQPGTKYHYRLTASNAVGTNYGYDQTFVTVNIPGAAVVLWRYDVPSSVYSAMPSPALGRDGTIYLGTAAGLYAITNAGSVVSNKWIFGPGASSTPAIASDGTIYFQGRNFYAVNPDGSQKWAYPFWSAGNCAPAIALDETIYTVADGRLYAFTPGGAIKWTYNISSSYDDASPVIGPDGTIYIANDQWPSTLFALRPDGTLRWSVNGFSSGSNPFIRDGISPAIGSDGTIYSCGATMNALAPDGTWLWSNAVDDFSDTSPIIGPDGSIYVSGVYRSLHAINPDGAAAWQSLPASWCIYQAGCVPGTTPVVDAIGRIYYTVSNGITAFTPNRQVDWTVAYAQIPPVAWDYATTAPVIGDDGTIYAVLGSTLYAIAGTNTLANSSWPMYRQNPQHTGSVEKTRLSQPNLANNGEVQLQFFGRPGFNYTVQTSADLINWTALTNVAVVTIPVVIIDPTPHSARSRFYRVISR